MQHLQYLPYGEPYVDQRTSSYNERFTFTGKAPRKGKRIPLNKIKNNEQRDEETGYSYFGARYMDHELMTMWLSVDPMADKYPSISPYAYCNWNPVKLVDPDGKAVWEVDESGHVKKTSDKGGKNLQTVKYANGNVSKFLGSKYHSVMTDLSTTDANNVSASNGGENMQSVYANVFKSMADNTNVEWRMCRFSDDSYALGTKHDEARSPETDLLTKGAHHDKDVVALIHSHPMVSGYEDPTSTRDQIKSMGYWDLGKKVQRITGDYYNKRHSLSNCSYYTYFPRTKQLWSVGSNRPAFIKKINSVSSFFFGTYNTR